MNKDLFENETKKLMNYLGENKNNLTKNYDILKYEIESRIEFLFNESAKDYYELFQENKRLNNIINEIKELADKYEMGKYDYNLPVFELKEILEKVGK